MIYLKITGIALMSLSIAYSLDMSVVNLIMLQGGAMLMLLPNTTKQGI